MKPIKHIEHIIRTSRISLNFSNLSKKEYVKNFILQYKSLINAYIDVLWGTEHQTDKYLSYDIQKSIKTKLPARAQQCAGLRALKIIKSQLKSSAKNKIKPVYDANVAELDERFIQFIETDSPLFNEIFQFRSGDRSTILCPIKHHSHYNKFKELPWKRKKSVRIRILHDQIYLDVFFEKEFESINTDKTIGLDAGIKKLIADSDGNLYGEKIETLIDKINRKKQKSKAWYQAIKEKNYYINETVKSLPVSNYILEDIKRIRYGIKSRGNKVFRDKMHFWSYKEILRRVQNRAGVVGVQCLFVPPSYTSQTCYVCGRIHKMSREGEMFRCVYCGHMDDADVNASRNILKRGLSREYMVPGRKKASIKD